MVATRSGRSTGPDTAPVSSLAASTRTGSRASKGRSSQQQPQTEAVDKPEVASPPAPLSPRGTREEEASALDSPGTRSRLIKSVGKAVPSPASAAQEQEQLDVVRSPGTTIAALFTGHKPAMAEQLKSVSKVPLPDDVSEGRADERAYASEDDLNVLATHQAQVRPDGRKKQGHCGTISGLLLAVLLGLSLVGAASLCWCPHATQQLPPQLQDFYGQQCPRVTSLVACVNEYYQQALAKATDVHQQLSALEPKQLVSQGKLLLLDLLTQLKQTLAQARMKLTASSSVTAQSGAKQQQPSFQSILPISTLLAVVHENTGSQQYAQVFWASAARDMQEKGKAAGLLLLCRNGAECMSAMRNLAEQIQAPEQCLLQLDGNAFSAQHDSASQLQARLCSFLSGCPHGVVTVTSPGALSLASVAVLNNALSELGHLTRDGKPVATSRALFVLMLEVGSTAMPGAESLDSEAKAALRMQLLDTTVGASDDTGVVRAFMRRIDVVLPVRTLPEPQQLHQDEQQQQLEELVEAEQQVVLSSGDVPAAEAFVPGATSEGYVQEEQPQQQDAEPDRDVEVEAQEAETHRKPSSEPHVYATA